MSITGITRQDLPEILTAAQEVALCRQIEAGVLAAAVLDGGEAWPDGATVEELELLARLGEDAWHGFIEANLRLVTQLALESGRRSGLSGEEFFQEGCVALAEALRRFDHRQGNKFSTYAMPWVRNAMHLVMARRGGALDAPVHRTRQARMLRERRSLMEARQGRPVGLAELAEAVGRSTGWVQLMLASDQPSDDIRALEQLACPGALAALEQCERSLPSWLHRLGSQEAAVLRLRYGLDDGVERSYESCARRLGVSTSTVRRLERRGLGQARELLGDGRLAA